MTKTVRCSLLDIADPQLSGLHYAVDLQKTAATVGFDWPDIHGIILKIREELDEVADELKHADKDRLEAEIGDLLFAVTNLARHLEIDPEQAVSRCNQKFIRRFHYIEKQLALQGKTPENSALAELDALWEAAKAFE